MKNTFTLQKMKLMLLTFFLSTTFFLQAQVISRYSNPIPVPYQIQPNSSTGTLDLDIEGAMHNFDPSGAVSNINLNVPLATYTYNDRNNTGNDMTYLGPTFVLKRGETHNFDIANFLPNGVNTTVHWHGLNIPARADGGPHQVIQNGQNWFPSFTMIDNAQTAWYHTHLMNQTTDQVIRGLAGMILVKDDNETIESQLPNDYGQNDFPIIIQEKGFELDTTTSPPTAVSIIAGEKPGNGPYTLVNGVVGGYLRVPPEMVRLRILNGSPRKMYNIGLSTTLNNPTNFADMYMIATGGGYLPEPIPVKNTLMSIGDRREFMVDFSLYPNGDTVYVTNLPVPSDANYGQTPGSAIMAFVVWDPIFPPNPIVTVPSTLNPSYDLAPGVVNKTRTKRLMGNPTGNGQGGVWTINGTPMDLNTINDTVLVNSKERWQIINTTTKAHPFHIHKVQFQVVEYVGKAGTSDMDETYTFPDLPPELIGFKDVQLIRAGATMTFEARFDSFPSPPVPSEGYMYHCHILTHEDTSMMHQFVVVDSTDFFVGLTNIPGTEELPVFPNPASNTLSFKGNYEQPGTLRFYDLYGRLIHQKEVLNLSNATISVGDLPRGTVIVEFTSGEKHYISKVLLR